MKKRIPAIAAFLALGALAAGLCSESGNDTSATDDGGNNGGNGVAAQTLTLTADEIEAEIEGEPTLSEKPYRELIIGQVEINCPEVITDNLIADKTTECTARDESGRLTEFRVSSQGKQYEWSATELTAGLVLDN